MEKSLVVLKPDAVQRGVIGEIITRFERAGLKIVAMKMIEPDESHYFEHYETIGQVISRRGQKVFDDNLDFMQNGPVIAIILEGVEAVSLVRKMVGDTEPKSSSPGTIRGDYAHMSYGHANEHGVGIPNLIHASGNEEEAKLEIALWFSIDELHSYETLTEKYTNAVTMKSKDQPKKTKK
jgi:nucleoside-diphosphate kinase